MFKNYLFANPATTLGGKVKNIFAALFTDLLWTLMIGLLLIHIYPDPSVDVSTVPHVKNYGEIVFFGCIWAPLWEELAFRYAPIAIVRALGVEDLMVPVIVISSLIFGWGHGNGAQSLLLQGVSGMIMSILYIKNNYSYWSTVVYHSIWNILVTLIFPAVFS